MEPYYRDEWTSLYLGDCREVLPALGLRADVVIADPPYQETSLEWDSWPDGWPAVVADVAPQMWCFGSMRMFFDRLHEFTGWKLAQDVVWEKDHGSGFQADRFRKTHEHALHWYQGRWSSLYMKPPREPNRTSSLKIGDVVRRAPSPVRHAGEIGASTYVYDGTQLVKSVIRVPNMKGRALHPTQKPVEILSPLLACSCPPGGLVLSPFAGSGSDLVPARLSGRRAVGVEGDERFCEVIATRLGQGLLFDGEGTEPAPVPAVPRPFPGTPLFDVP